MNIHEAVRELRGDQSRQLFATKLGLSLTAVQNYETDREPDTKALVRFLHAAVHWEPARPDLELIFTRAILETGDNLLAPGYLYGALSYRSNEEWHRMRAVQWMMNDKTSRPLLRKFDQLMAPIYDEMEKHGLKRMKLDERLEAYQKDQDLKRAKE